MCERPNLTGPWQVAARFVHTTRLGVYGVFTSKKFGSENFLGNGTHTSKDGFILPFFVSTLCVKSEKGRKGGNIVYEIVDVPQTKY